MELMQEQTAQQLAAKIREIIGRVGYLVDDCDVELEGNLIVILPRCRETLGMTYRHSERFKIAGERLGYQIEIRSEYTFPFRVTN